MQENHSNCSRVAQYALVLGPSGHVQPNPIVPAQPADSTIQSDFLQESAKPEFPPIKSIADFLLFLFQDRKLQPSTSDSHRSAITDNWEIYPVMSVR